MAGNGTCKKRMQTLKFERNWVSSCSIKLVIYLSVLIFVAKIVKSFIFQQEKNRGKQDKTLHYSNAQRTVSRRLRNTGNSTTQAYLIYERRSKNSAQTKGASTYDFWFGWHCSSALLSSFQLCRELQLVIWTFSSEMFPACFRMTPTLKHRWWAKVLGFRGVLPAMVSATKRMAGRVYSSRRPTVSPSFLSVLPI